MAIEMETIEAGDIVQFRSGGPQMTAEQHSRDSGWLCKWFNETELKSGYFFTATLTKKIKSKSPVRISPQ